MPGKLVVLRGLQGSGKTTYATKAVQRDENTVRVSRDDLRYTLFGKYWGLTQRGEAAITAIQREQVKTLLSYGYTVLADNTNLRASYVREWARIAEEVHADFQTLDFPIPVEEAIKRDAERDRVVGEDVIRDFAQRFTDNGVPRTTPVEDFWWDSDGNKRTYEKELIVR